MRNGPFLAGYLTNLVSAAHGAKHCGSADGPATTSGPAARAVALTVTAAANTAPMLRHWRRIPVYFIVNSSLANRVWLVAITKLVYLWLFSCLPANYVYTRPNVFRST